MMIVNEKVFGVISLVKTLGFVISLVITLGFVVSLVKTLGF